MLVLVCAVALTTTLSQQQQTLKQHASSNTTYTLRVDWSYLTSQGSLKNGPPYTVHVVGPGIYDQPINTGDTSITLTVPEMEYYSALICASGVKYNNYYDNECYSISAIEPSSNTTYTTSSLPECGDRLTCSASHEGADCGSERDQCLSATNFGKEAEIVKNSSGNTRYIACCSASRYAIANNVCALEDYGPYATIEECNAALNPPTSNDCTAHEGSCIPMGPCILPAIQSNFSCGNSSSGSVCCAPKPTAPTQNDCEKGTGTCVDIMPYSGTYTCPPDYPNATATSCGNNAKQCCAKTVAPAPAPTQSDCEKNHGGICVESNYSCPSDRPTKSNYSCNNTNNVCCVKTSPPTTKCITSGKICTDANGTHTNSCNAAGNGTDNWSCNTDNTTCVENLTTCATGKACTFPATTAECTDNKTATTFSIISPIGQQNLATMPGLVWTEASGAKCYWAKITNSAGANVYDKRFLTFGKDIKDLYLSDNSSYSSTVTAYSDASCGSGVIDTATATFTIGTPPTGKSPLCDSGPTCDDSTCSINSNSANTCSNNGTEKCNFTTYSGGGACTKAPTTPKTCSVPNCTPPNTCNASGQCATTQCTADNAATKCYDSNTCTKDLCGTTGTCANPPLLDGTACTDPQSKSGICSNGVCKTATGTITLTMPLTVQDTTLPDSLPVNLSLYDFTTGLPASSITIAPQTFTNTQTAKGNQYLQDVQIPNLPQGKYTIVARTSNNMIAKSAFAVSTNATAPIVVSPTTLVFGDLNNDNNIDTMDYENVFKPCWLKTKTGTDCVLADFKKNGVDQVDYNLFERGWATWSKEGHSL